MVKVDILSYQPERHSEEYKQMFVAYGNWLNSEVKRHYGVFLIPVEDKKFIENLVAQFTSIKPPEGDIYIVEVDGRAAAMGRISTLMKGIGEVNNVYTRPEYRRKGYSKMLMSELEDQARKFGFTTLRLDTAGFNIPAQRLYQKLGYTRINRYSGKTSLENEKTQQYYDEKVYMEKKL